MSDIAESSEPATMDAAALAAAKFRANNVSYGWYVVSVLAIVHALAMGDRYLMGLAGESIKADLALTDTQLGLIQGPAFLIIFCVVAVPIGLLADKLPRKWLIAAGVIVWSAATALVGVTSSFWTLAIARAFAGMGEATLVPAGLSLISAYVMREKMGRASGVFTVGATVGKAAAFIGGGAMIGYLALKAGESGLVAGYAPWRWVFILAGILGVAVAFLLVATVREPARPKSKPALGLLGDALKYIARNIVTFGGLVGGFTACYGVTLALAAWAVSFFVRVHGLDIAEAGGLVGILALIGGPAGAIGGSWICDRLLGSGIRSAPLIVIAGGLAIMIFGSLSFVLFSGNPLFGAIGYLIIQTALSACVPCFFAGSQLVTPVAIKGAVASVLLVVYLVVGGSLGPTIVGIMTDNVFTDPGGIGAALTLSAFLMGTFGIACALLALPHFRKTMGGMTAAD